MDDGERDLLSLAISFKEEIWWLCGPDKATLRAMNLLGILEKMCSLQLLAERAGARGKSWEIQYTEKWLSTKQPNCSWRRFDLAALSPQTSAAAVARPGKQLLGGYAALMLKFVLRFWTPRFRANPRLFSNIPSSVARLWPCLERPLPSLDGWRLSWLLAGYNFHRTLKQLLRFILHLPSAPPAALHVATHISWTPSIFNRLCETPAATRAAFNCFPQAS